MKKIILFIFSLISLNAFAQPQEATLLGTWNDPTLPSSSDHENAYNEIWGLAVNENEIAVIGSTMGTHFINVTNPSNPSEIMEAFVPGAVQGSSIIHRDYHDLNGYLYAVADEGQGSTLQIIDISDLPNSVSVVYDSNDLFRTSHNIFIDSTSSLLYACAVRKAGGGSSTNVQVIDISNPTMPVLINDYNGIPRVHDIYVEDNIAYANCEFSGLFMVDFTTPTNPLILGSMSTYTQQGYNHSGWLANDKQHYYLADETFNTDLKVVDVSDFDDISVLSTFNAEQTLTTIPHNLIVRCDQLYVSYYYEGLQIYDISNPANPVRTHFYDTSTETNTNGLYRGNWGVYPFLPSGNILASDMQNGLFVFEAVSEHNCENIVSTKTPTAIYNNIITFPQPATDYIQIELQTSDNQADTNFELIDLTGKIVQVFASQNLLEGKNEITFDLNNSIPNGIYFLRISSEKGNQSHKIVIGK